MLLDIVGELDGTLRVQMFDNRIVTQILYDHYYYPGPSTQLLSTWTLRGIVKTLQLAASLSQGPRAKLPPDHYFLEPASQKLWKSSGESLSEGVALRVQVPYNHILTQNLYHNYYYPKPKYLIFMYLDPLGRASETSMGSKLSSSVRGFRAHVLFTGPKDTK